MEKNRWLEFLSSKIKSEVSLDTAGKVQNWGIALMGLVSFGFALDIVREAGSRTFLFGSKVLFMVLFHLILLLGVYLPGLLQRGEKPIARLLGLRDFTSLVFVTLALLVTTAIPLALNIQVLQAAGSLRVSGYFVFMMWACFAVSLLYVVLFLFSLVGFAFFPQAVIKVLEKGKKVVPVLFGVHSALFIFLVAAYWEITAVGSPVFMEHLRVTGLFWMSLMAFALLVGRILREGPVRHLMALESEIVSGRLERHEDILVRFKESYVPARFSFWLNRISHRVGVRSHEIAECAHETVSLIARKKPSETDLRKVEEDYKRANGVYKKLEKENQRFLICAALLDVEEVARGKMEELKDQFSRELRHAKLELASVRKKIDDKLVQIKNAESRETQEATVEKIPLTS
ncbi:MAG: hypothetical protein JW893_02775 [Candidatus Omnitrophica bacterium]|nr:hypothetical protein [Candidatus Omnitrophota bacterium]